MFLRKSYINFADFGYNQSMSYFEGNLVTKYRKMKKCKNRGVQITKRAA